MKVVYNLYVLVKIMYVEDLRCRMLVVDNVFEYNIENLDLYEVFLLLR